MSLKILIRGTLQIEIFLHGSAPDILPISHRCAIKSMEIIAMAELVQAKGDIAHTNNQATNQRRPNTQRH